MKYCIHIHLIGLLQIISQDNSPHIHVEAHDAVVVDFIGQCASDRDDDTGTIFHNVKDWIIIVGDKEVTPALEMGVRFMKQGERAVVYSHSKFAYGPLQRRYGSYELPPHSNVTYHIHVKSVISSDETIGSASFQLELAKNKKNIGNDVYANEWSDGQGENKVLMLYKKAGDAMSNILGGDILQEEAKEVLIDCLNNTSAVHMRTKHYGKAKEAATQVLIHDPNNIKALLRAAKAAMLDPSCSFDESNAAIHAAEEVDTDNVDVKKLRAEIQRRQRDYKIKSKAIMAKMSQAMKVQEITEVKTTTEPSEINMEQKEVVEVINPRGDTEEELDRKAQKWVSYMPFFVQFVILIISYFWLSYFGKSAAMSESDIVATTVQQTIL